MLETMLTAGGTGKRYPNSGPGPQTLLFGDTEEGYFGRVPVGEMITGDEVKAQLSFTGYAAPQYWLKFYRKKEVLFIGVGGTLASGWNNAYNAGLIYGVDGDGDYPNTPPVNQLRIVRQGEWAYIVRALRSTDASPSAVNLSPGPGAEVAMLRKTFVTSAYGTAEWDKLAFFIDTVLRERYLPSVADAVKVNTYFSYAREAPRNSSNVYPVLVLTSLEGRVIPVNMAKGELAPPMVPAFEVDIDPALVYPAQPSAKSSAGALRAVSATAAHDDSVVPVAFMTGRIPKADTISPRITFTPNEV